MKSIPKFLAIFFIPVALAIYFLGLAHWDLSIPLVYSMTGGDDIWQLILTKVVVDTGWALVNPFMGAPGIADWHYHSAAQTSALHSVIMLAISAFVKDAVKVQQIYYLLNFGLITASSYIFCRTFKLNPFVSFCIGLLYSFTTFRINMMFYAYLANYFLIPLALIPVFFVIRGDFANHKQNDQTLPWTTKLFFSKKFLFSCLILALMATFDGYYAFFTVLLLGFSLAIRIISGDYKNPLNMVRPLFLIIVLLGVATTLSLPLSNYKRTHPEEFFPGGIEDPILARRPMEAEVYSSSLKLLIAPINNHRLEPLRELGKYLIKTSDDARAFKINQPIVSLGTIPSIFLIIAFSALLIPSRISTASDNFSVPLSSPTVFRLSASISFFIFLCCITGGVGSLVAIIFPVIRAYDRFPLFLIFTLYICAGSLLTQALKKSSKKNKPPIILGIVLMTSLGIFDQIPYSANKTSEETRSLFLAERSFVNRIEKSLPAGSMIYQYPYSNYLIESKYYGLGQFSHGRLYLHSKKLRWSNGASKNSPVDKWHMRTAKLPIHDLITEISTAGFKGIVIDKSVIPTEEYNRLINYLTSVGSIISDDAKSKLVYASTPDLGYSVKYSDSFDKIESVHVTEKSLAFNSSTPLLLKHKDFTEQLIVFDKAKEPFDLTEKDYPGIFVDSSVLKRGTGELKLKRLDDLVGALSCSPSKLSRSELAHRKLTVKMSNLSSFPLIINEGPFPFGIGVHLRNKDGAPINWDNGYRLNGTNYFAVGATNEYNIDFSSLRINELPKNDEPFILDFGVVQDGHAWFNNFHCLIQVTP